MFRRLPDFADTAVRFTFDGRPLRGRAGDTVAAALLGEGVAVCRSTPVTATVRGPFCLMGICFDCLVTIDGASSRKGCLVPLVEGMRVQTESGARPADDEGFDA